MKRVLIPGLLLPEGLQDHHLHRQRVFCGSGRSPQTLPPEVVGSKGKGVQPVGFGMTLAASPLVCKVVLQSGSHLIQ